MTPCCNLSVTSHWDIGPTGGGKIKRRAMVTEVLTRSQVAQNGFHGVWSDAPNWRRRDAYRPVLTHRLVLCRAVLGAEYLSVDSAEPLVDAPGSSVFNINISW